MLEILAYLVQGWPQIQAGFDEDARADPAFESSILCLGRSNK
jgi:hypothetical protein